MIAKLKCWLLNKCSLCIHIKVVFSNSQNAYDLANDILPLCNRIECQLEICKKYGGIALFCKWGSIKGGVFFYGGMRPLCTLWNRSEFFLNSSNPLFWILLTNLSLFQKSTSIAPTSCKKSRTKKQLSHSEILSCEQMDELSQIHEHLHKTRCPRKEKKEKNTTNP